MIQRLFLAMALCCFNQGLRIARAATAASRNDIILSTPSLSYPHNHQHPCNQHFSGLAFTHRGPTRINNQIPREKICSTYSSFSGGRRRKNKFATYRGRLALTLRNDIDITGDEGIDIRREKGQEAAQSAVSVLAQKSRTWKRLSNIVELATTTTTTTTTDTSSDFSTQCSSTIADIGCDHGLLAIALASSGQFKQVIGADISSQAIQNGAMNFHNKVMEVLEREGERIDSDGGTTHEYSYKNILPVEFRVGNGLEALNPGEAEAICLAGMGVPTMLSILDSETNIEERDIDTINTVKRIDYLGTKSVYLQPPTSRPIKLMELYEGMQKSGWILSDERIVFLKKRWYITSAFHRQGKQEPSQSSEKFLLPGHFLSQSDKEDDQKEYRAYLSHHLQWLNRDHDAGRRLDNYEMLWREENLSSNK